MATQVKERTLEETSTWAVAVVCFVLLFISIVLEHSIHKIGTVSTLRFVLISRFPCFVFLLCFFFLLQVLLLAHLPLFLCSWSASCSVSLSSCFLVYTLFFTCLVLVLSLLLLNLWIMKISAHSFSIYLYTVV